MIYNALPWPSWRAALAPDYTLMMPINMRSESAYHTDIPNRPNTGNAPDTPANDSPASISSSTTESSNTSRPVISGAGRLLARLTTIPTTNQSSGNSSNSSYSSVNGVAADNDNDNAADNDDELALSDDSLLPSATNNTNEISSSSVGSLLKKGMNASDRVSYSRLNTNDEESGGDKNKKQQHDSSGGTTFNPMAVKDTTN